MPTTRDVTSFGASTALTDNAAAIQAALDDAYAVGGPDQNTVTVGPGVWNVKATLRYGSYVTISLDAAATIRWTGTANVGLLGPRTPAPVAAYGGEHHVIVEGGTWDGNHPGVSAGTNILSFAHAEYITVRQTRVHRPQNDHCIEFNSTRHGLIEDCVFGDMYEKTEAIQIDLALSSGTFPLGLYDQTPCDGITIRRCVFEPGCGSAVGSHSAAAGVFHSGIRLEDCDVPGGTHGATFRFYNYRDLTLVNCRVLNSGENLILDATGTAEARVLNLSYEMAP